MVRNARRVIPRDTLIDMGRVTRPPLRVWARRLLATLAPGMEARRESWDAIVGCMNNSALIEVFRGDLRSARHLCDLQIRWIANLARVHGLAAVGGHALQPWVNIGRLLRIQGDREGALRHFALLPDTMAGKPLSLGAVTIDPDTWQEITRAHPMTGFLQAVYLHDSVKTYLSARDAEGALAFIAHVRSITKDEAGAVLDEAELMSLGALERYAEALAVTERPSWLQDDYCKLVRVTYRVALSALTRPVEQARKLVGQLGERVLGARLEQVQDQRALRYLHYLGEVARYVEDQALAGRIWEVGLRAARHQEDVPLELACLDSLLALEDGAERGALEQEREALLRECLYVPLLKPRGQVADAAALADPVFDALIQRLEEIAASPLAALGASAGEAHARVQAPSAVEGGLGAAH